MRLRSLPSVGATFLARLWHAVRAVLAFGLTILIVVFAVMNRQSVAVYILPLKAPTSLPVYGIVLGALVAGFFIGAIWIWIVGDVPMRWRAYRLQKALDRSQKMQQAMVSSPLRSTPSSNETHVDQPAPRLLRH